MIDLLWFAIPAVIAIIWLGSERLSSSPWSRVHLKPTRISHVREGRLVAVHGIVRVLPDGLIRSPLGDTPCVAYWLRAADGRGYTLWTEVGSFEVDDGSGSLIVLPTEVDVLARPVPVGSGAEAVIRDGDPVIVVGRARLERAGGDGYRVAATPQRMVLVAPRGGRLLLSALPVPESELVVANLLRQ